MVSQPEHPRASKEGYVLEHILIAERALGHALPDDAEVHHVDGNKAHNANNNLVICQDRAYHMLLHLRMRALKACGNPDARMCKYCGHWDAPSALVFYNQTQPHHVFCRQRARRQQARNMREKAAA